MLKFMSCLEIKVVFKMCQNRPFLTTRADSFHDEGLSCGVRTITSKTSRCVYIRCWLSIS